MIQLDVDDEYDNVLVKPAARRATATNAMRFATQMSSTLYGVEPLNMRVASAANTLSDVRTRSQNARERLFNEEKPFFRQPEARATDPKMLLSISGLRLFIQHESAPRDSSWRDRVISIATYISLTEVLATCVEKHPAAYAAISASHLVADAAKAVEPALAQFAANKEVEEIWNRSVNLDGLTFAENVAMTKGMLSAAQLPSQLIRCVHDHITANVSACADATGLTGENIAAVAHRSLELIAEHSPELCEEKIWAKALQANK